MGIAIANRRNRCNFSALSSSATATTSVLISGNLRGHIWSVLFETCPSRKAHSPGLQNLLIPARMVFSQRVSASMATLSTCAEIGFVPALSQDDAENVAEFLGPHSLWQPFLAGTFGPEIKYLAPPPLACRHPPGPSAPSPSLGRPPPPPGIFNRNPTPTPSRRPGLPLPFSPKQKNISETSTKFLWGQLQQ